MQDWLSLLPEILAKSQSSENLMSKSLWKSDHCFSGRLKGSQLLLLPLVCSCAGSPAKSPPFANSHYPESRHCCIRWAVCEVLSWERCVPSLCRSVRTLCDHAGTGSELTFCKGEELVVLGGVDQDWIRCRQGDREGLVPIGYTSLIM